MKLLLLFSLVFLLAVSFVGAQETAICPFPKMDTKVPKTNNPQAEPKETCVQVTENNFPTVPDAIKNAKLKRVDGTIFSISEYKGRPLLIHLWASWNGPALAELPALIKLQRQYKSSGLTVVGVNLGDLDGRAEDSETIKQIVKRHKVTYDLVGEVDYDVMNKAIIDLTKLSSVPQTLLIDRQGKFRAILIGGGKKVDKVRKQTVKNLMREK